MGGSTQSREYMSEEFSCITGRKGELGAGGFGVVRLAFHEVLGPVAVKCFHVGGGSSEKDRLVRDVKSEMESLQKANHSHILHVHGWTEWSGSIGLVMEYMPGGNLKTLLSDKQSTIKTGLRLRFGFEIADAISFIHNLQKDMRMTHSDVKPENVLLTMDLHCKLADFGGAKFSPYTVNVRKPRKKNLEVQEITLVCAAPERLADDPVPPKRNQDTYSYGLILYLILTKRLPDENYPSLDTYMLAIMRGRRPDTTMIAELKRSQQTARDAATIDTLHSVMKRCWDHKPDDRPNMLDVRDELHQLFASASNADITRNVADELERLNISEPLQGNHPCASLDYFDIKLRRFPPGIGNLSRAASTPQATQKEKVKLPLTDIFLLEDQTALPSNVQPALGLLESCKKALKMGNYEEIKTMKTKLISILEDNIDATAEDVGLLGIKLREKKLFLESIVIFDVAFSMFVKMRKTEENLEWMMFCVKEIKDTNKAMIGHDVSAKVIVKKQVIPLMREKLRHIEDTSLVSKQFKCLQMCWVLHFIEYSEGRVDECVEREKTLNFALIRMETVFGSDVIKHQVYGHLLNNIGNVCYDTSRLDAAVSFYKQATDAYKAATDFNDEEIKEQNIEKSENNLKIVQQKMK